MSKLTAVKQLRIAKEAYTLANDSLVRVPLDDLTAKGLRDLVASVSALIRTVEELMVSSNGE
jgi:hypothetical protein